MKNKTKFYLSSLVSVTALLLAMYGLWILAFPAPIISFPSEVTKVVHNANNGTVTITYKWFGDNHEVERGFEPNEKGYGHHILVFRCPNGIKAPEGSKEHEEAEPLVTYQYLFVHYGEILEVNIPDRGWFVEMHDGNHLAIEVLADGTRQLAHDKNGNLTK